MRGVWGRRRADSLDGDFREIVSSGCEAIISQVSGLKELVDAFHEYARMPAINPQPTDPVQAKVFLMMPIVFTFLLAQFPAGLVIYWTWNNLLSIIQQMVIMKRAGVPIGRQGGQT